MLNACYQHSQMPVPLRRARISLLEQQRGDSDYAQMVDALREYEDDAYTHVTKGHGLYLFARGTAANKGGTGTGKTTAAAALMNAYLKRACWDYLGEPMAIWYNVPKLLDALRPNRDETVDMVTLEEVPLLVLDDLGSEKPTEWTQERLYSLFNARVENGKATFVTANGTTDQVGSRLGVRMASRLETLFAIPMEAKDSRKELADE